jgi:hypothetical protein
MHENEGQLNFSLIPKHGKSLREASRTAEALCRRHLSEGEMDSNVWARVANYHPQYRDRIFTLQTILTRADRKRALLRPTSSFDLPTIELFTGIRKTKPETKREPDTQLDEQEWINLKLVENLFLARTSEHQSPLQRYQGMLETYRMILPRAKLTDMPFPSLRNIPTRNIIMRILAREIVL